MLKYWWAEYCINSMKRREKNVSHLHNDEKRHLADSKIRDKDVSIDFFYKVKKILIFINHDFYLHTECQ